jgi:Raf kinase inhibitor-like YbhB/YbcL family protein
MKITSPAFADKIPMPLQYTSKGTNQSPPLEFIDAPKETASFVLIVEDLDSGDHRIHWLVYNIPGNVSHFDEGKIPEGAVDGICNDGTTGYKGPCPPEFTGVHRYCFKLYALDSMLDVAPGADVSAIESAMRGHVVDTAELSGVAEGEKVSQSA